MDKGLIVRNLKIATVSSSSDSEIEKTVFDSLSFSLDPTESMAIMGPNGSGKSLLSLALVGLLDKETIRISGEIIYERQNLLEYDFDEMKSVRGLQIGLILQDSMSCLNPTHTIEKQIKEAVIQYSKRANINYTKKELDQQVDNLLRMVQLPVNKQFKKSFPHSLSGGQKQRVVIALTLALKPSVLIADEPTSSLDNENKYVFLDLIKQIKDEYHFSLILISHDQKVVDYLDLPIFDLSHSGLVGREEGDDNINNHESINSSSVLKTPQIFSAQNIQIFRDETFVVSVDNFVVSQGEIVGLIGANASGKTSFAMACMKMIPYTGDIHCFKKNLKDYKNNKEYYRKVQYVFQDSLSTYNPLLRIYESIVEGKKAFYPKLHEIILNDEFRMYSHNFGLSSHLWNRYPYELSGGQRQRFSLIKSFLIDADLYFLDEPTASLDYANKKILLSYIKEQSQQFLKSFVLISHDEAFLKKCCNRIYSIENGILKQF